MRATEKKRKPFMTARKWTVFTILMVIAVIMLIIMIYTNLQRDYWQEQDYVKLSLREELNQSSIDYAEKYVWDETYWIVKGMSDEGIETYIVWQDLTIIHRGLVSELLTEQQLTDKLLNQNPNLEIEHIQPAFFRGELSYELQTISKETGHKLYTFYSMRTGNLIDQFTIVK